MNFLVGLLPGGNIAVAGLRFITSTFGAAILAALIAFGVGYSMADRKADFERLEAELAVARRDFDTTKGAASLAQSQAASMEARLKTNQDRFNALQADLQKRGRAGACALDRDDARRLSDIR
jgi:hypothetical protein